jgi:hypothetical protein
MEQDDKMLEISEMGSCINLKEDNVLFQREFTESVHSVLKIPSQVLQLTYRCFLNVVSLQCENLGPMMVSGLRYQGQLRQHLGQ